MNNDMDEMKKRIKIVGYTMIILIVCFGLYAVVKLCF